MAREDRSEFAGERLNEVAALARAGLLFKRMETGEFCGLMDAGFIGEGMFDHVELLDGEIVIKAMGKGNRHARHKSEVVDWFVRHRPRDLVAGIEPSIDFSKDDMLEPDVVVYARGLDTRTLSASEIVSLIEIPDSTLPFDLREKARGYAGFGVDPMWVVGATRRQTYVSNQPAANGCPARRVVSPDAPLPPPFADAPPFRLADLDLPVVNPF